VCKWSLFKVREEDYKREHGGGQVESGGEREFASVLRVLLKFMLTYVKGGIR
jgi:hypothetical protein